MENKKSKFKEIIGNVSIVIVVVTIWLLLVTQMGINVVSGSLF